MVKVLTNSRKCDTMKLVSSFGCVFQNQKTINNRIVSGFNET